MSGVNKCLMSEKSKAVFLSYASQDTEAALRICEALNSAGIEVWFDRTELRGGDAWDHKIRHQIRECALFLPIISAHTQSRPEGYFRLEWHLADRRTHLMGRSRAFLVPVCVDDTPELDADVPDSFSAVHWTRLPHGNTPPAFIERISHLLAPQPTHARADVSSATVASSPAAAAPRLPDPLSAPTGSAPRLLLLIGAAVSFIAIGYFALNASVLSKRTIGAGLALAVTSRSGPSAIPEKSIAVLPFVNMSGDPRNDYFSDGITEEILYALAQIPNLKVAARTSAFAFKGKEEDLRELGRVLDVATVLEGSVQKSGDEVRITAQLVNTRSGYHLWSERYDRKLTSIFAVEDEISKAIANKLKVQWSSERPLVRNSTRDVQAHALYLQGIAAIAARGTALRQAVVLLEQATARDAGYAAAWAQLSQAYELLPWYQLAPWQSSLNDAERAARRALALDEQSAEAHAALANVLRDRFAFAEAGREYRRALELNPGLSEVHNQYGQLLDGIGRFDAAMEQERVAIAMDPLAPNPQYMLGILFDSQHQYAEASAAYETVIRIAPRYTYSYHLVALSQLYAGEYAQAQTSASAAIDRSGKERQVVLALIAAVADPAKRPKALPLVAGIHRIGNAELDGLGRAFWYSLLGARERAVAELRHWAETAPQGERFNGLRFLWMPAFDPVRNDPRFKAVLTRLGLPYTPLDGADAMDSHE